MGKESTHRYLSDTRLKSYQCLCSGDEKREIIGAYQWNLLVSQNLYPFVHSAEIVLRNTIHAAASEKFNTDNWVYLVVQDKRSKEILNAAMEKLKQEKKRNITPSDMVAELSFGFWVELIKRKTYANLRNKNRLWPELIPNVFPHYKRADNERRNIANRFDEIKRLRNRLFHHEPIWKSKKAHTPSECIAELRRKFKDIFKAIGWMSSDKKNHLRNYGFVDAFKRSCELDVLNQYKSKDFS